jgi:hypothetical protein
MAQQSNLLCRGGARFSAISTMAAGGSLQGFLNTAVVWGRGRRFIIPKGEFYGLAPILARVGDKCAIIRGLRVPIVLRKTEGLMTYNRSSE